MSGAARFSAASITDEVLEAAANRGLVRRARRDAEAGLVDEPAWEEGTAILAVDGETVRLAPGPLSGATCTCPATGACRHILTAVIALREAPPGKAVETTAPDAAPAPDAMAEIHAWSETALAKAFGRAALVRAEALLAGLGPGEVAITPTPGLVTVRIAGQPDVLLPAGAGPGGLVSKAEARERAALHAAAVLAIRRPEMIGAGARDREPEPDAPSPVADAVAAALREAARSGLSAAPAALEERIGDLALSSRIETMPRLAAELRAIAAALRRHRERLETEEPGVTLRRIAGAYALTQALREGGDRGLGGTTREVGEPLPPTRFLGCGLELWRGTTGGRGATAHLLRLDDGAPFALTLARAAGADPGFSPLEAAQFEPVLGATLAELSAGAFRLVEGAARPGGRLSSAAGRATREPGSWSGIVEASGAVSSDWSELRETLRQSARPSLRARPGARLVLLRPVEVERPAFDTLAQCVRWPVGDAAGLWLSLELPADDRLEARIEALEAARRARPVPILCVLVRAREGAIVLEPIAIAGETLRSLDLPTHREGKAPARSFFGDWARRFDALRDGMAERNARRLEPVAAASPLYRQTGAAADELLALAELGGRMEDPERLARIERFAGEMRLAGFETPARLLGALASASRDARAHHLLVAVHALDALQRLEPALPFVAPRD
ncbi:hypothetical protein [Aureimonas sp. ME7]|uniref:hypothetical protein n=1 Tax=Aureimonas sp. ME7 TaxID=2744252 RepID=UPI0015F5F81A|nr:hypothetical protein [Aureimonas sp. ME7]